MLFQFIRRKSADLLAANPLVPALPRGNGKGQFGGYPSAHASGEALQ